jgi:hypothetical protein
LTTPGALPLLPISSILARQAYPSKFISLPFLTLFIPLFLSLKKRSNRLTVDYFIAKDSIKHKEQLHRPEVAQCGSNVVFMQTVFLNIRGDGRLAFLMPCSL